MSKPNRDGVTFITYLNGYALSLYLTITAYLLVTHRVLNAHALVYAILGLALVQFLVQAFFFLHLGHETRPRWKLGIFLFMLLVVLIIVIGSIWIMVNLSYRHPESSSDISKYLNGQDGL